MKFISLWFMATQKRKIPLFANTVVNYFRPDGRKLVDIELHHAELRSETLQCGR